MGEPLGLGYGALRRWEIVLGEGRMPSVFEVGQSSGFVPKPKRPERVSALRQTTLTTWIDLEDGISYIDVPAYPPPAPHVQTLPSLEWSSGSLPVSPAPSIVPLPVSSPMIPLTGIDSFSKLDFTTMMRIRWMKEICYSGAFNNDAYPVPSKIVLSPTLFERILEHEQERFAVTFGAIWRPILALELWVGQTDAQRVALWHAISDTQRENRELRLQIIEERRARLDLAEIVDSMKRGQEPRGDV
ncbi:hypothetical protein Tco_1066256 [Tanacetum coccineum]|uniref:Uncharacterized protein n=1 Tax=Tanacetum coccineum TaxID=301880 RepID=A0ABQ5HAR5_9ASTR